MANGKARPEYLTAQEVADILKITKAGAYKAVYKLAARGAEVLKVSGVRIKEDDFYEKIKEFRI